MPKRLAIAIITAFLTVGCYAFPTSIHAQGIKIQPPQAIVDMGVEILNDVQTNLNKFQHQTASRVLHFFWTSIVIGLFDIPGQEGTGYNNRPESYYGQGLLPTTVTYTAQLMNRPVKTADYVADVLHNTNLIPQAYAQGIGFNGLAPILSTWKAFRNMSYFLFIIIFVIIGFMIMFRKKISSNTVVSIQEALPKIIVTLIIITFSYAIAGFVIDLMYLSIYALMAIFESSGLINNATIAANTLFSRNILGIGISYFTGFTEPAGLAAESMGRLVAIAAGGILGTGANILFYLIFAVAVLIAVFRTFIQLVMAYIGIIISTIFAPLLLLPNAFPGNDSFGNWLRSLLANAIVFPVACAIIVLGATLTGKSVTLVGNEATAQQNGLASILQPGTIGLEDGEGFTPPLLYSQGVTNLNNETTEALRHTISPAEPDSGGTVNTVRALIGFGLIMMLPEVVKISKDAFKVKDSYGEASWKNMSAGWSPLKSGYGQAMNVRQQWLGLRQAEIKADEEAHLHGTTRFDPYVGTGRPLTPAEVRGFRIRRIREKIFGF